MWFFLYLLAISYDLIGDTILEPISFILDPFVALCFGILFASFGIDGWLWPLLGVAFFEEIPFLNILPGYSGLIYYLYQNQPVPEPEEVQTESREETIERQNNEDNPL